MSTIVLTNRFELTSAADTVLKAAARFWFFAAVIGQWAFIKGGTESCNRRRY